MLSAVVTKESDVGPGAIAEFGTSTDTVAGTFGLISSVASPGGPDRANYSFRLRGLSANVTQDIFSYAAPHTAVVSAVFDLSQSTPAGQVMGRVNGAAGTSYTTTTSAGGGNFGNATLYLGMRAGTSLGFIGRTYAITLAGQTIRPSESVIRRTEKYGANLL